MRIGQGIADEQHGLVEDDALQMAEGPRVLFGPQAVVLAGERVLPGEGAVDLEQVRLTVGGKLEPVVVLFLVDRVFAEQPREQAIVVGAEHRRPGEVFEGQVGVGKLEAAVVQRLPHRLLQRHAALAIDDGIEQIQDVAIGVQVLMTGRSDLFRKTLP